MTSEGHRTVHASYLSASQSRWTVFTTPSPPVRRPPLPSFLCSPDMLVLLPFSQRCRGLAVKGSEKYIYLSVHTSQNISKLHVYHRRLRESCKHCSCTHDSMVTYGQSWRHHSSVAGPWLLDCRFHSALASAWTPASHWRN